MHGHIHTGKAHTLDRNDAIGVTCKVHYILIQICILFNIYTTAFLCHNSWSGIGLKILLQRLVHLIDVLLGALCKIYVSKTARRSFHLPHGVKIERILSVVVPAPLGILGIILGGKQHRISHILAVMQYLPFSDPALVVPIHNQGLILGLAGILLMVFFQRQGTAAQLALQLGVHLLQLLIVPGLYTEEVLGLLNIRNTGLPEQIEYIHLTKADITQPVQLFRIPENAGYLGAASELIIPAITVNLLILAMIQDYRDHRRQLLCLRLILLLTGQNVRHRKVVHGICVLICNGIKQPSADRFHLIRAVCSANVLPMPQLEPLLIGDHSLLQALLAVLVFHQDLLGFSYLLRSDHRRSVLLPHRSCTCFRFRRSMYSHFLSC